MAELTLKLLGTSDFNPEKYVRNLSQNCVGGQELVRLRAKIYNLSEETNNTLKKNVYQNYMQFIDTAKEISHLESEMYQLSHLLSEHKNLLNSLSSVSILDDNLQLRSEQDINARDENEEETNNKQKISAIIEKVEGCMNFSEESSPLFLHEDDLLEIDSIESTPLRRIHAYLFSEGLMITTWNANRRGPMRYKFETFYEIGSLAVVNVRDLGNVKHAFKLLAFPDTRVFQCTSNAAKKEWLDKFDQAKKSRLTQNQVRKDHISERSPVKTVVDDIEEEIKTHPEWILESSDELEVHIAQRHFEDALNLLQKAKDYLNQQTLLNNQSDPILMDIKRKVEQKEITLTEVLMKELELKPEKSLQGGLRASRRAVRLLNKLGRSVQACELLLKLCSSIMKIQCKRVKREGSAAVYVRHLSSVVFTNMCHMTEEFLQAFPNSPGCTSAFVVWTSKELSVFTNHFVKQVFISQTSLSTSTECVILARDQCARLCDYGIDLCYQLDGTLRTPITKALHDARDKMIEAIKIKASEDRWIPTNYKSKFGLSRCLQEHAKMGLPLEDYVIGDCWLQLTSNTLAFSKLYLNLLEDCLQLQNSELTHTIDSVLCDIFQAQVRYTEQTFRSETQSEQKQFIVKNAKFLLVNLLNVSQKKYAAVYGFECSLLKELVKEHSALLHGVTPTTRQVTKYSSNEYL